MIRLSYETFCVDSYLALHNKDVIRHLDISLMPLILRLTAVKKTRKHLGTISMAVKCYKIILEVLHYSSK